jgi:septal ring factor EnvC (AmiA/AmiB activator)
MSPEERERMMQFLLNQQAQFAADFERHKGQFDADMKRLSAKTDRIAEGLLGLTSIVGQLAAAQQRTDAQLRETDARLRETDARLTKQIENTDSHLNVVIHMFERHLREDHGRPPA